MTPICPYCQQPAKLVDSATVYRGKSYGMVWDCRPCNAYVGCHKAGSWRWEGKFKIEHTGTEPLGTLADKETRAWRIKAHNAFDPVWKNGWMTRVAAYQMLREKSGLAESYAHISKMTAPQCKLVVEWFLPMLNQRTNPAKSGKRNSKPPVTTQRSDLSLPSCACPEAPWAHCKHTEPTL